MKVLSFKGYELEKALPNTSEDFFNRSEVEFELDGEKAVFSVTYLRYFEEGIKELPLFSQENRKIAFKDLFALHCILTNPQLRKHRKLYISDEEMFNKYVSTLDEQALNSYI